MCDFMRYVILCDMCDFMRYMILCDICGSNTKPQYVIKQKQTVCGALVFCNEMTNVSQLSYPTNGARGEQEVF